VNIAATFIGRLLLNIGLITVLHFVANYLFTMPTMCVKFVYPPRLILIWFTSYPHSSVWMSLQNKSHHCVKKLQHIRAAAFVLCVYRYITVRNYQNIWCPFLCPSTQSMVEGWSMHSNLFSYCTRVKYSYTPINVVLTLKTLGYLVSQTATELLRL
jgi:hypothetical protein